VSFDLSKGLSELSISKSELLRVDVGFSLFDNVIEELFLSGKVILEGHC
jgi:hypothetical protein